MEFSLADWMSIAFDLRVAAEMYFRESTRIQGLSAHAAAMLRQQGYEAIARAERIEKEAV